MEINSLIVTAGSIPALASQLGVSAQTVYTWRLRGIPETRQSWIREKAPKLVKQAEKYHRGLQDRVRAKIAKEGTL